MFIYLYIYIVFLWFYGRSIFFLNKLIGKHGGDFSQVATSEHDLCILDPESLKPSLGSALKCPVFGATVGGEREGKK